MTYPTPWIVQVWERSDSGDQDPHRNAATFTPALNQPGTSVAVYGWHLTSADDPVLAGHPDRAIIDVVLFAPPGLAPPPDSRIGLPAGPAGVLSVVGHVRDYNFGPYGFMPGNVVALRKVDG